MRVAVVGAGIAGLAAAHELLVRGATPIVFDADTRAGGKLRTEPFGGVALDTAPDSFLARRPEAVQLCTELGLRDRLEAPAATHAHVYARGRLRRLPAGLVLGVPTDPVATARAGILSRWGAARAALEPFLPGAPLGEDEALGAVIRRRYGNEVTERLVDPLLGGINAGDVDRLSIDTVAPQIAAAARRHRSLTRALRAAAPAGPPVTDPVFLTLPGGLEGLVDALTASITERGGEIRSGDPVSAVTADAVTSRSGRHDVDGVVLATPGRALLRVSAGRHGDERAMHLDDDDLVARLRADLAVTMDLHDEPAEARVVRWPQAFPQYAPGHRERMAAAVTDLAAAVPAVALAGAALDGVGIPACIGSGRTAARSILDAIG